MTNETLKMAKNTVSSQLSTLCVRCEVSGSDSSACRLFEFCGATIHFPHPEFLERSPEAQTCLQSLATGSCLAGSRCPRGWRGNSCRGCTWWSCVRAIRPRTTSPIVRSTVRKPRPAGTERIELSSRLFYLLLQHIITLIIEAITVSVPVSVPRLSKLGQCENVRSMRVLEVSHMDEQAV